MRIITKTWLKITNKEQYKINKEIYNAQKANKKFCDRLLHLKEPANLNVPKKNGYSFKHSGNSGDIIYALPAIYSLASQAPITLYLHLNQPTNYSKTFKHPLGNVMLNKSMFERLQPLLLAQPGITSCTAYADQSVDYNLDIIRDYPFPLSYGNIARWYFLTFAINADLGKPWLYVQANPEVKDYVVIARSQRYHAPNIDYSFLATYENILFVGLPEEFADMRAMIPKIEYQPVDNFLELAEIIAGCKFFIGNQSFPFSIAEALKVKRLLEVCFQCPNVSVEGINGFDFCYQPQFEKIVEKLYYSKICPDNP
ncbi:MAG: hypothetical protein PHR16_02860 [Methylovulum sp.]|nr:hypothetical protein [Methylovulum sp.]